MLPDNKPYYIIKGESPDIPDKIVYIDIPKLHRYIHSYDSDTPIEFTEVELNYWERSKIIPEDFP